MAAAALRAAGVPQEVITHYTSMSAEERTAAVALLTPENSRLSATQIAAIQRLATLGGGAAGPVTHVNKTAIVLSILAAVIFSLGISVAAGSLTKIGPLGGLALGGFTTLLALPVLIGSMLAGGLGCGIGGSILGGGVGIAKGDPAGGCTAGGRMGAVAGLVAGLLATVFVTYFIATIICNKFSTLPSFTYAESLKVMGHGLWMGIGLSIISCCMMPARQRAQLQAFGALAVTAGSAAMPRRV